MIGPGDGDGLGMLLVSVVLACVALPWAIVVCWDLLWELVFGGCEDA